MTVTSLLARRRSKAAPGPGPLPEALLRALELSIARRIEGLLAGEHRSASIGIGTELALIRPYQPGDDVRRIDWKVTARTNHPHVRMQVAERTLTTWLVLDNSPSMIFGTADRRKWDVAEGVALAVGHVAARRGGRLGLLTYGDGAPIMRPPRQGRVGLRGALLALDHGPRSEPVGPTSLGDACRQLSGLARQRGVVVLVGDFRGPRDWEVPLGHLLSRHQVLAVEIRDRREHELPNVGELLLMDPETGRQLRVDTSLRRLRESYATTAAVEREEVAAIFRSVGVRHLVLFTSGDWLRELAGYLRRERRGW